MKETMTVDEVAKTLGLAVFTVKCRIAQGVYPFGRQIRNNKGTGWRWECYRTQFNQYLKKATTEDSNLISCFINKEA